MSEWIEPTKRPSPSSSSVQPDQVLFAMRGAPGGRGVRAANYFFATISIGADVAKRCRFEAGDVVRVQWASDGSRLRLDSFMNADDTSNGFEVKKAGKHGGIKICSSALPDCIARAACERTRVSFEVVHGPGATTNGLIVTLPPAVKGRRAA